MFLRLSRPIELLIRPSGESVRKLCVLPFSDCVIDLRRVGGKSRSLAPDNQAQLRHRDVGARLVFHIVASAVLHHDGLCAALRGAVDIFELVPVIDLHVVARFIAAVKNVGNAFRRALRWLLRLIWLLLRLSGSFVRQTNSSRQPQSASSCSSSAAYQHTRSRPWRGISDRLSSGCASPSLSQWDLAAPSSMGFAAGIGCSLVRTPARGICLERYAASTSA